MLKLQQLLLSNLRPFVIIADCTGYSSASEIPIPCFKFCLEIIPSDLRELCKGIHVLHPNMQMQRFLRKVYNVCAGSVHISHPDPHEPTMSFVGWNLPVDAHVSVRDLSDHLPVHKNALDLRNTLEHSGTTLH